MTHPLLALIVSGLILLAVLFLYRIERKRGKKFFEHGRTRVDFWVLKTYHFFHVHMQVAGKYLIRQIMHYFVHTFLSSVLGLLVRFEQRVKVLLQSNRTLARKTQRERTVRNKLEEVALHKIEVALTEEEKRKRRDIELRGK